MSLGAACLVPGAKTDRRAVVMDEPRLGSLGDSRLARLVKEVQPIYLGSLVSQGERSGSTLEETPGPTDTWLVFFPWLPSLPSNVHAVPGIAAQEGTGNFGDTQNDGCILVTGSKVQENAEFFGEAAPPGCWAVPGKPPGPRWGKTGLLHCTCTRTNANPRVSGPRAG